MSYFYIATSYSKDPRGITAAFVDAAKAAAGFMRQGHAVFSPIAHAHPIAIYGGLDPLDAETWLALDEHLMAAAVGLFVVHMDGWDVSDGIAHEIAWFQRHDKPVRHFIWPDLAEL